MLLTGFLAALNMPSVVVCVRFAVVLPWRVCFLTFPPVPLTLERKLKAESAGFSMYFHLVYSPEFFAAASGRQSTRKIFRQATKLMVLMDQEFLGSCSSSPFAFLSCPFHMGISLLLGKRPTGVFWVTHGCEKPR